MSWPEYLKSFHDTRPGVTEQVLSRSHGRATNPYAWLAAVPRPDSALDVLDLACGNAPLQPYLSSPPRAGRYVGVDVSMGELVAARGAGRGPLVRADAAAIPLADGGVDVVVCSMGLMLLSPLAAVLTEIRRVLAPGGLLVATVPATGPLRPLDLPVVGGLVAALGRGLRYPNDPAMRCMPRLLARAGLRLEADERRRFGYRLREEADGEVFLSSLYLPGLPERRYDRARAYLRALARAGVELPIPIRRVVARRSKVAQTRNQPRACCVRTGDLTLCEWVT